VDVVGQEVVPPGVSTTLDKVEQVEPKCLVKRSIFLVSHIHRNIRVASRCADGEVEAKRDPAIVNRRGVVAERPHQAVSVVTDRERDRPDRASDVPQTCFRLVHPALTARARSEPLMASPDNTASACKRSPPPMTLTTSRTGAPRKRTSNPSQ
jgi:hypothetical protein